MRPKRIKLSPQAANTSGFAAGVTGSSWPLTATSAGDFVAHRVTITNNSLTDHSTKTATLVGTDADGHRQTEVLALPAASATVISSKYFKTLESVTPSASIGADTMDIGWNDQISSQTVPIDFYQNYEPSVAIVPSGTISATVQTTSSDVFALDRGDQSSFDWIDDSSLVAVTVPTRAKISNYPPVAVRVITNSFSSGASLEVDIISTRQY